MSENEWTWQLRTPAKRTYDELDKRWQDQIAAELDEILADQWRDPDNYFEPLPGPPHSVLCVSQFRLGVVSNHDENILDIYTIEWRAGAYRPGDE